MKTMSWTQPLKDLLGITKSQPIQKRFHRPTPGEKVMGKLYPNRGTSGIGSWSQDRIEQVLHLKNWTYVAIDAIASKIGQMLPNLAYVHNKPKKGITRKAYKGGFGGTSSFRSFGLDFRQSGPRKALSVVKPQDNLEPLEYDHPLRRLIENPNPEDSYFDYLYESQMFLELTGVCYTWMVPGDGTGLPRELWCIPSHWVWPRTSGGINDPDNPYAERLIQYYEVRPWGTASSGTIRIPPDQIIMEKWKSPVHKIDGWATTTAIAQWIDSEESISRSRWSQFINAALPQFWIKLGPQFEDPDDVMLDRFMVKFQRKFAGEANFGKPIMLPAGAEAQPLSFSPQEMAYVQSEEQIRDMILAAFRVPKVIAGISNDMTFGALLGAMATFCSMGINPRLTMRGLAFTRKLCSLFPGGDSIRCWWDDCVPSDPQQQVAEANLLLQGHAITPNELRARYGMAPYKHGGDDPLVPGPGGVVPLPLNTGDDWTDLGELVPTLGKQEEQQPGMPGMGQPGELQPGQEGEQPEQDELLSFDELVGNEVEQSEPEQGEDVNALPTKAIRNRITKFVKAHRNGHQKIKNSLNGKGK